MYDWVDFTHNHLAGKCPHRCKYCSTQDLALRFPVMHDRYTGPPRIIEKELSVNYGTGKTIFVENCSDLFADGIPEYMIISVLNHLLEFPRQLKKWGVQDHSPFEWLAFLTEEVGELASEIAELEYRNGNHREVVAEAIQVATLALKIAEMHQF